MKRKRLVLSCRPYPVDCLLVVGGTATQFTKDACQAFRVTPAQLGPVDPLAAGHTKYKKGKWAAVWLRKKHIGVLVHELLHVVTMIANEMGLSWESEEAQAYLLQSLVEQTLAGWTRK